MTQTSKRMGGDFRRRVITSLIGLPIILAVTVAGGIPFLVAACITGGLAAHELSHMLHIRQRLPYMLTLVLLIGHIVAVSQGQWLVIPLASLAYLGVCGGLAALQPQQSDNVRTIIHALIGTLYIGGALGVLVLLRLDDDGLLWTLMLFFNNWSTDSFALIGGRLYGKHKLAPTISPGKTIEGAFIGLACGMLMGIIVALIGGVFWLYAVVMNLFVAIATELGDLLESLVKRTLDVKDSGSFLPGHGGVLDRIDGTMLAAPALFILLILLGI